MPMPDPLPCEFRILLASMGRDIVAYESEGPTGPTMPVSCGTRRYGWSLTAKVTAKGVSGPGKGATPGPLHSYGTPSVPKERIRSFIHYNTSAYSCWNVRFYSRVPTPVRPGITVSAAFQ